MGIKCFFLEISDQAQLSLRRYAGGSTCPGRMGYHDAEIAIGCAPLVITAEGYYSADGPKVAHDDPRWPTHCECGYGFADLDNWQCNQHPLYRRSDTGELVTLRDAPPGAMWYADWMLSHGRNHHRGPDGHYLMVKCPDGHDWCVDGKANNCTMPDDWEHKCWIRHGTPPNITVDKNGNTCAAGAGSILTYKGKYHGFLRNGEFT